MNPPADSAPQDWWVICLCAEWCGVCREWRGIFDQAAAAHPGARFAWVDVEDEAQAMGDVDIETFPTLLIAQGTSPRFLGPVPPSGAQLARLIASLRDSSTPASGVPGEAAPLLARIAPLLLSNL